MTWRWYGEGNDSVTLKQIKQIPGVEGIVWALHNKAAGEVWEVAEIEEVRKQLMPYGFNMDVVESVNVHDDQGVEVALSYYREFNSRSLYTRIDTDDFYENYIDDIDMLNIRYNYDNIIIPILQIFVR